MFGQPQDPISLVRRHLDAMSDDWCNDQNHYCKAILCIEEYLSSSDKHLVDFFNIDHLHEFGYTNNTNLTIDVDDNNNLDNANIIFVEEDVDRLNEEHSIVFNAVTTTILEPNSPNRFFS